MNINILRYSLFGIAGGQEVDRNFSLCLPSYNDCIVNKNYVWHSRQGEADKTFSNIAVTRHAKSHGFMQIGRICKARRSAHKQKPSRT